MMVLAKHAMMLQFSRYASMILQDAVHHYTNACKNVSCHFFLGLRAFIVGYDRLISLQGFSRF